MGRVRCRLVRGWQRLLLAPNRRQFYRRQTMTGRRRYRCCRRRRRLPHRHWRSRLSGHPVRIGQREHHGARLAWTRRRLSSCRAATCVTAGLREFCYAQELCSGGARGQRCLAPDHTPVHGLGACARDAIFLRRRSARKHGHREHGHRGWKMPLHEWSPWVRLLQSLIYPPLGRCGAVRDASRPRR